MDATQIIALLAVVATVVAALIAGAAQILAAKAQRKAKDEEEAKGADTSSRWKHIVDPRTASLEERIVATHLEASMSKQPHTELKVIQEGDIDAKQ